MKIERTITISGSTVTNTQSVDTGAPVRATPPANIVMAASAASASAPAASAPAAATAAAKPDSTKADPKGGNEGVPTDTGGSGASGAIIVFGPITLNFPADGALLVTQSDTGGNEGVLTDTGGGKPALTRKPRKA